MFSSSSVLFSLCCFLHLSVAFVYVSIGLPPPGVHSSEAVVLHKISHASSTAELKVAENEVMHLSSIFRAVVMQSGMKQVLDKALHSAAARCVCQIAQSMAMLSDTCARLKDPEMILQYAQQLKGPVRRPLSTPARKIVHT